MLTYILFLLLILLLIFIDKIMVNKYVITIDNIIFNRKLYGRPNKKRRVSFNFFFGIAVLVAFCFSAFRYDVGWDYMAYYTTIQNDLVTNIVSNNEYFNIFLVELSQKSGVYNLYFFISTFITLSLILLTLKNYSLDSRMSFIIYLTFPLFFLNSLSVIRNFVAIAICFYGFKYIEQKNFIKYLITVIIASMFHKSALISLAFYIVAKLNLSGKKMLIILFASPVITIIINYVVVNFFPRYSVYLNATEVTGGTKAIYLFIILGVISIVLRKYIVEKDRYANIYFNIYFIGLCIYLAFFEQGTMGHRLSLYGTIYSLLLIPKIISLFNIKENRLFLTVSIYTICIASFFYTIYVGAETYIPFKTIWNK